MFFIAQNSDRLNRVKSEKRYFMKILSSLIEISKEEVEFEWNQSTEQLLVAKNFL